MKNKDKVLQEISEEILSRSILSVEDISNIISVRLDLLIKDTIKDKLTTYEKKKSELQASRKGLSGKKLVDVVKQQQVNNLLIKKCNLEIDKAQNNSEYTLFKEYVKENIGGDFLNEFWKTI